ncbi:Ig-like domain-containing protein, partial [Candidatus Aerophobetes bacterium]|nr:Ig-like domain-containing protein [Candidatus Aerophobetes bacterium]
MKILTKKFIIFSILAFSLSIPVFVYGAAYSEYSNQVDKTVTAVTGCEKDEDCSGETPCCNLKTGQCVENYGKCGIEEPKSATKPFSIITGEIGSCLVDIKPNKGPWGTAVTLYGDAFRESKDSSEVTFNGKLGRINADYTDTNFSWTNTLIENAKVPTDAIDGEVRIVTSGIESNGLFFDVTGGEGDFCGKDLSAPTCDPDNNLCSGSLVCDSFTCTCQLVPGIGESCDENEEAPGCQLSHSICQELDYRLACDVDKGCTCQLVPGIGESCDENEEAPGCQLSHSICQELDYRLACDIDKGCTCQLDLNIGAPCYEGASTEMCNLEESTCQERNIEHRKYICDPLDCTCQLDEPRVVSTVPEDGAENVCRNALISATFNQILDKKTLTSDTIFLMGEEKIIEAKVSSYDWDSDGDNLPDQTVVNIAPFSNLKPNTSYEVTIKGKRDGVKQIDGIGMSADYKWVFTTSDIICQIDHVDVTVIPPGSIQNNDLFRCAGRDDCLADQDKEEEGNQHIYVAQAKDKRDAPLIASYSWAKEDFEEVISGAFAVTKEQVITAQTQNGQAVLYVQAEGEGAGLAIGQVQINVFLCENPWPLLVEFPYGDTTENPKPAGSKPTNFATWYCRDAKSPMLPGLEYPPTVVSAPPEENLIKEFLFPNKVFMATESPISKKVSERIGKSGQWAPGTGWWGVSPGWWGADTDWQWAATINPEKINFLEYTFDFPEDGTYRAFAETSNIGKDLSVAGFYHQIKVYLDGEEKGIFYNLASLKNQIGGVVLGNVNKGTHTIKYEWANPEEPNLNLKFYTVGIEKGRVAEDVIGIRVYNNPENIPIFDWYYQNVPNPGTPESIEVSGYEALRDERTVYVNVTNIERPGEEDPDTGRVSPPVTFGVVYLISYNKGAVPVTVDIFNQMVENWQFYPKMIET